MQIVLNKINQAKKNNWDFLDLSGLGINELPKELFEITQLKTLILGKYRTPQKNSISVIPKEIAKLTNLEILDLTDNKISSLPNEISNLKKLKKIVLSNNNFIHFPQEVLSLTNLEELFIGNNKISVLPKGIEQLQNLTSLRLNNNYLKSIPDGINLLHKLDYLYLFGNPIKNVQKELLGLTSKDNVCPIVKQWFLDKERGGESYVYEAKLILVGEAEAGKTSLSEKLREPSYVLKKDEPMTKGVEVQKWEFDYNDTQKFQANIWDFGGQDIMHATHRYFLTERSLYVLVVDVRAEKTDFYYWLNMIELFGAKSPVIIVLNEKHSFKKELPNAILSRFKDIIVGVFDVNLQNNEGLDKLTKVVKNSLKKLPHIGTEKMLNRWLSIRDILVAKTEPFISFEDYEKITKLDTEQSLRISRILHELGVFLHFQNDSLLRNTIILNKSWATEAVYLVLLDKKVTENFGKFTFKDLDRIWANYPASKRNDLVRLMVNFLLCYEVESNKTYIAPQLLSENPKDKSYLNTCFGENEIYFRYHYAKFMPKGIISQLIVKLNRYIHGNLQWKTGVVFKIDNAFVEVTEKFYDRQINIRVSGSDKRNALTILRKNIEEINESFEKAEKLAFEHIPCGCLMNEAEEKPYFIERKTLEKYKEGNEKTIKCNSCLKDLRVLQLLDNVIGDDSYLEDIIEQTKNQFEKKIDEQYILDLMKSENNEVEFKATFLVPVLSKDDKKFLEDEYPLELEKSEKKGISQIKENAEKKKKEIYEKLKTKEQEEIVIHSVVKTLVAFANSNGGELVIGIDEHKDDTPYIFGMEKDLEKIGGKDALMKKFDEVIENRIGNSFSALIEKRYWITVENKEIWLLRVKPSSQEIYCNNGKTGKEQKEMFYVRREVSTVELVSRELVKYTKERF